MFHYQYLEIIAGCILGWLVWMEWLESRDLLSIYWTSRVSDWDVCMCQFFLGFLSGSFVFLTVFLVFCGCVWGKSICSCQRIEEPEPGPGFLSFPTSLGLAVDDLFGSPPGILATQLDNVILGQQFSDQKPGDFHRDVFSHVWWHFSSSLKKIQLHDSKPTPNES